MALLPLGNVAQCLLEHSRLHVRENDDVRSREVRFHGKNSAKLLDRLLVSSSAIKYPASVRCDDQRSWIQLPRAFDLFESLREPSLQGQELCIPVARGRVVGIQLDRFPVLRLCLAPV